MSLVEPGWLRGSYRLYAPWSADQVCWRARHRIARRQTTPSGRRALCPSAVC